MTDMELDAPSPTSISHLPAAVIATILLHLDVPSICSCATTSRSLRDSAAQAFSVLPSFHLLEISPSLDLLGHLLPPNPYLRSLKLDCRRLDDSAVNELARDSLEELALFNCYGLSGRLLFEIGRRCGALRSLSLRSLGERKGRSIMLSQLREFFVGCSQLESLSLLLDFSHFESSEFAETWKPASGRLINLEISYIPAKTVRELFSKTTRAPTFYSLQKLTLAVDCITDAMVNSISEILVCLNHLDLQDAPTTEPSTTLDLTNSGLQQVNRRGKLKHLSLVRSQEFLFTYFKRVNDLGFLLLADTCPELESIRLGGFCRVTDTGFRAILHSCPNLCKLKVSQGSQLTDLLFHDMAATSLCLTHVSLRRCNLLTDLAVTRLSSNQNLIVLDLRDSRHLGDQAIRFIADLPKLQFLLLDGTDISDHGVSRLGRRSKSLVSLSVRGCRRISDGCISSLFGGSLGGILQAVDFSRLPNLSDNGILLLARSGAPISELRLRDCPLIGDVSVMALASVQIDGWLGSTLKILDLYNCRSITALSFRWFKRPYFPRLRWLGVTGSSHKDLVEDLAKSRPFLHVAISGEELGAGIWEGFRRRREPEEEDFEEVEE